MSGPKRGDADAFDVEIGGETLVVISMPAGEPVADLSPAELEVARAAVSGKSNAEIARLRGTSVRTIANQLASIFRKLGVGSRSQLAVWFHSSK